MCSSAFIAEVPHSQPTRTLRRSLVEKLRARRAWTRLRDARLVDLTHPLWPGFPVFPRFRPPAIVTVTSIENDGFLARELTLNEHTGTHVDAPAHYIHGGTQVDRLEPAGLLAPLAVVRIADRAVHDPDSVLEMTDLERWERRHGRIPRGAVVAVDSGWGARAHDAEAFVGLDAFGTMHFPGAGAEAATFLVTERGISGLAVDTLSLDRGAAAAPDTHRVVLGAGCYGVECVAGLDRVPDTGAHVLIGCLPILAGSGAPARVLALA